MNFDIFREKSNKGSIFIQGKYKENVINKFSFIFIDENNNPEILRQKIQNDFIIIDLYTSDDTNSIYFTICFDYILVCIKSPEISQIFQFFSSKMNLQIYCISDHVKNFIQQCECQIKNENHFIFPRDDQIFIKNEIPAFFDKICNTSKENARNRDFWGMIFSCISAFLIKKAYINSKIDRKHHWKEFFLKENEEIREESLENFIELRLLGNGSFSAVYLYYNIKNERIYALKIFNNSEKGLILFEREYKNYKSICHPLVPKFYGTIELKNGCKCLLIEYLNGKTLNNIDIEKLTEKEKINIIFSFMIVIEHFHYNSCVYRDLKPSNIFIDENKDAFLIDFDRLINLNDISKDKNNQTTLDFLSEYIDPDILNGSNITLKADIYSIKKILHNFFSIEIDESYLKQESFFFPEKSNNEIIPLKISKLIDSFYYNYSLSQNEMYDHILFPFWNRISEYKNNLNSWIINSIIQYSLYIFIDKNKNIRYFLKDLNNLEREFFSDFQYVSHDVTNAIHNLSMNNKNDVDINYILGRIYLNGINIKRDLDKAIYHFEISAKQNDFDAMKNLAAIYCEKNDIEKFIYYTTIIADQQNNPDAQFILGSYYTKININKAIQYYTQSAQQDNSQAQYELGLIYFENKYVNRDINKSFYYFSLSANQNNSEAQFILACIFYDKNFGKFDIDKAIHYFTLSANQNNPKAQFLLASIYDADIYVKRDINKVFYYLTQSANLHYLISELNLGFLYLRPNTPFHDVNKGIYYLTIAANKNASVAQYFLGLFYYDGNFVSIDIDKAIHYFTFSANQNYADAQYMLGMIFYENKYVTQDLKKSIYYLSLAANQNHSNAQCFLGRAYFFLDDINKALEYFFLSAKQNNVNAQIILGLLYLDGRDIKQDIKKAIYYLQLAANQNNPYAQCKLGSIFYIGTHVPKDIKKAIYYFKLAANQNYAIAQNLLGHFYYDGEYFSKNIKKALYYYELAANQNNSSAQYNLGYHYYNNKYVQRDIKKSLHYLLKSAVQKNSSAQSLIGYIYYEGKYVPQDIHKAIYFLTMAANQNNSNAQACLADIYFSHKLEKNYNKAIYYLTIAADYFKNFNFILGFLYHEGKIINSNIEKSIHFYKEASTFNNPYAKNNLGIIYKNGIENKVEKNYGLAIQYFKEAFSISKDKTSKYNLAHLYLYNEPFENSIDECIKFSLSSPNDESDSVNYLLSFALIKKAGNDAKRIEIEIKKYSKNESANILKCVLNIINEYRLYNEKDFEKNFEQIRGIDLLYNYSLIPFRSKDIDVSISKYVKIKDQNKYDIDQSFYEGFNLII